MNNYQELAEKAVAECTSEARARASFAYYGELDLGSTWAGMFGQHRDSDVLARSNFRVILADLRERFPGDVSDERSSHWAVGWSDTIYVRMLDEEGKVTPAGIAALAWKEKLEDYPVASDDDYSELEMEQWDEDWDSWGERAFMDSIRERFRVSELSIPSADLYELWRAHGDTESDSDGSALFNVDRASDAMDFADVLPFDTGGELRSGWEAIEAEKAPYLRESVPPWEGNGSVSFGRLT